MACPGAATASTSADLSARGGPLLAGRRAASRPHTLRVTALTKDEPLPDRCVCLVPAARMPPLRPCARQGACSDVGPHVRGIRPARFKRIAGAARRRVGRWKGQDRRRRVCMSLVGDPRAQHAPA